MDRGQKSYLFIVAYIVLGIINGLGEQFGVNWLVLITKPLLIPTLITWFISVVEIKKTGAQFYIVALAAAWLGDVALLLHHQKFGDLFLVGIGCFGVTQILYTICLYKFHDKSFFNHRWGLFFVSVLCILILTFILPKTEKVFVYPVTIYSLLISTMLYQAITLSSLKPNFRIILYGAGLFYLSDLMIALTQFAKMDFGWFKAGSLIMFTYLVAQLLIAKGFRKYYENIADNS